ncbi:MAG: gamma-glutamyltransferase, partial [Actinobacteria bacterium]|nr:gamma-glutamyltransferase [Actinomycetota bacterium]
MHRPTVLREVMVATSHPLATRAGVRALDRGGNAVDAALASAAMLCVAEPGFTGIGGDMFAQAWVDGELHGLNGSGRSPAELPELVVQQYGPRSVTVPGSVRAWEDLSRRFGRLGLDAVLADAVDAGEGGIAATERVAEGWASTSRAPWPAPKMGETYT